MTIKIGAITVGQSPRVDVMNDIEDYLKKADIKIIQRGALDGMTQTEIESIAPNKNDYTLVTRLSDGTSVKIAEKHILPRIQNLINELSQETNAICMFCTGEFPSFKTNKLILYPQILLHHFVAGILGNRCLGIISPDAVQIKNTIERWHKNGAKDVVATASSPYKNFEQIIPAAEKLKTQGAELIVLDCIGYSQQMKNSIIESTGLPVILPRTVLAHTLCELFS